MDTVQHHGIKGQRWGVQNGPPYPLDWNDHTAAEKRAMKRDAKETTDALNKADRDKAQIKSIISDLQRNVSMGQSKAKKLRAQGRSQSAEKVEYANDQLKNKLAFWSAGLDAYERKVDSIIAETKQKGYKIESSDTTRYTTTGKRIVPQVLAAVGSASLAGATLGLIESDNYKAAADLGLASLGASALSLAFGSEKQSGTKYKIKVGN